MGELRVIGDGGLELQANCRADFAVTELVPCQSSAKAPLDIVLRTCATSAGNGLPWPFRG